MTKTTCENCHGTVMGSRKLPLEESLAHHLESCPGAGRKIKPIKVDTPVPAAPVPRKRIIPRQ